MAHSSDAACSSCRSQRACLRSRTSRSPLSASRSAAKARVTLQQPIAHRGTARIRHDQRLHRKRQEHLGKMDFGTFFEHHPRRGLLRERSTEDRQAAQNDLLRWREQSAAQSSAPLSDWWRAPEVRRPLNSSSRLSSRVCARTSRPSVLTCAATKLDCQRHSVEPLAESRRPCRHYGP